MLRGFDGGNNWNNVKTELIRYFGEEDSKAAAWRKLKQYDAGHKGVGEIAADVLSFARAAATEDDVRERLAVDAFLNAIPWEVARELKKKKVDTLKKAMEKAKTIAALIEEDKKRANSSMALQAPGHTPRVDKGMEGGPRWEIPRNSQVRGNSRWRGSRDMVCWACHEKGHTVRSCPVWHQWRQGRPNVGNHDQDHVGNNGNRNNGTRDTEGNNERYTREGNIQLNW